MPVLSKVEGVNFLAYGVASLSGILKYSPTHVVDIYVFIHYFTSKLNYDVIGQNYVNATKGFRF
jgi:hypothetical protein